MVGLQRNKDPELSLKERNTSYLILLDDRKHGRSGKFPLFYDIDTGDYLEPPEGFLESEFQTLKEFYAAQGIEEEQEAPVFELDTSGMSEGEPF